MRGSKAKLLRKTANILAQKLCEKEKIPVKYDNYKENVRHRKIMNVGDEQQEVIVALGTLTLSPFCIKGIYRSLKKTSKKHIKVNEIHKDRNEVKHIAY